MPEFRARLTAERFYRYHEGVVSSPKTIGAYRADLELLLEFVGERFDVRRLTVHEFFNSDIVRTGRSGKPRAATKKNRERKPQCLRSLAPKKIFSAAVLSTS